MKNLFSIAFLLIMSLELNAQTKLIIFSEDSNIFLANFDGCNQVKKGSNFFEFTNLDMNVVVLKILMDNNNRLKKTIALNKDRQNIYSISNDGGFYEILFRGDYDINQELPVFEFNKNSINNPGEVIDCNKKHTSTSNELENEIYYPPSKLVNINQILDSIKGVSDEKEKTTIIVKELNKGKYNCRQLSFLFTKIKTDYSKLYTFKSTANNCIDKENLKSLKNNFKSKKYKSDFLKLVSYL